MPVCMPNGDYNPLLPLCPPPTSLSLSFSFSLSLTRFLAPNFKWTMPSTCIICNRSSGKKSAVSFHRFPPRFDPVKRNQWLKQLGLADDDVDDVGDHHRICSKHFPNGDSTQVPSLYIGKKFQSPKKMWTARAKRAAKRKEAEVLVSSHQKQNAIYVMVPVQLQHQRVSRVILTK